MSSKIFRKGISADLNPTGKGIGKKFSCDMHIARLGQKWNFCACLFYQIQTYSFKKIFACVIYICRREISTSAKLELR